MRISAETLKHFRAGVRTRLARAGKKLSSIQEQVLRIGTDWAGESKARAAEWSGLTQSFVAPPDVSAIAMLCPSGEMTLPAPMPAAKSDSAGGLI